MRDREFVIEAGIIALSGLLLCFFLLFVREWVVREWDWTDFPGQWRICAYVLKGVDHYPYIGVEEIPDAVKSVGVIPARWGAVPWGTVLGNVFYFGFLNVRDAGACYIALCVVSLTVTAIYVYRKANEMGGRKFAYLSLLLSACAPYFIISMMGGNAGCIICCMLILVWIFCDKRPVIAGILLGLAMTKPQNALIICFALLLSKKFVPVIVAAVIDISAWLAASVLTGTGMIELLREFAATGAGGSGRFSGIFTVFVQSGQLALILSMAAGIAFVFVMSCIFRRRSVSDPHSLSLCFSYVASTFWCYAFDNDNYVLLLPAIVCVYIMMNEKKAGRRIMWFVMSLYCNYGVFLKGKIARRMLQRFTGYSLDRMLGTTLYETGLIAVAIMILLALCRSCEDSTE